MMYVKIANSYQVHIVQSLKIYLLSLCVDVYAYMCFCVPYNQKKVLDHLELKLQVCELCSCKLQEQ